MSETDPKEGNQSKNAKESEKSLDINVTAKVDPEQMKELIGQVKDKEKEIEELKNKLTEATTGKDELGGKLEDAETERDDLKNKMSLIAKQELEKKKAAIMTEAKKHIKDEDRLKIIEDGIKRPEDLKATEFLIETLRETIVEGQKQSKELEKFESDKKALGAPETVKTPEELEAWKKEHKATGDADPTKQPSSGTLSLEGQRNAGGADDYGSYPALVRDLRRRSHSENPEEAAEAKAILKELFRKWTVAVKKRYEGKISGVGIKKGKEQASLRDITLHGGAAREDETTEESD